MLAPAVTNLREFTPARVALGRTGVALPTRAVLEFALDQARARDAVHAAFDAAALISALGTLGLDATGVSSRAGNRRDYLRRPDLGRRLDPRSVSLLQDRGAACGCSLAIVVGDGLSPRAVHAHAVELMRQLMPQLMLYPGAGGVEHDPHQIEVVVASGARVALGDEVGALLNARMVVVLIGERPGLSAPDSLGAYLTFAPKIGRTDAERNCVSNIHHKGLDYAEAALKIGWLVREATRREVSGVALKDDSGEGTHRIAAKDGPA